MAYNFLELERNQLYLLPPSVIDWLEEDHLAFFVLDVVDEMDLDAFYADYRSDGRGGWAHDPKMMVSLLLYAYCIGLRSSRQIERACHVDVAFRVITANQAPDHTTISRFRQRHEEAVKALFCSSLKLCAKAGMASLGLVALDGTKISAVAGLENTHNVTELEKQVDKMLAEAAATDAEEDAAFGESRGDEPPALLRGRDDRRRRLEAAKKRLEDELAAERAGHEERLAERARKEQMRGQKFKARIPKPPHERANYREPKANTSDPDSRVMRSRGRYLQGYNAQAVANEDQVVLAAEVSNKATDDHLLHPMIDAMTDSLAAAGISGQPEKLLADAGYTNEENLATLDDTKPDIFLATNILRRDRVSGKRLTPKEGTLLKKMEEKVSSEEGKAIYKRRKVIIEPIFGQIKQARGIRTFMRRGLGPVDSEWKLICATHNLLKLYRRALAEPGLITP